ncbi:hypothetical protein NFI96_007924, partial [Prochilodus magdalenae]
EPQDAPPSRSESLSSLDSLENELPQQDHDDIPACSSPPLDPPEFKGVRRPQQPNHLCPLSDHNPSKSFLEEVLSQQGSSCSSSPSLSPREDDESADEDQNLKDLTQAVEQCKLAGQSEDSYTQFTPGCQNVQARQNLAAHSGYAGYCFDGATLGNISSDQCKTRTVPASTPLESMKLWNLTQESKLHGQIQEERDTKHPPETQANQPARRCKHRDGSFQASSSTAAADVNLALHPVESEDSSESCKKKLDSTVLQRETKPKNYEDQCKKVDASNVPDECRDRRVPSKSSRVPEEPDRSLNEAATSCPASKCDVRFLKGILKKNSKYVVGETKFTYTPGHFVFPKQVAMSIRDSMELTRAKAREPESDKSTKKKLRWFDEVNGNEEECEERPKKDPNKQAPAPPSQQPSADHQQELCNSGYINTPTGIPKTSSGPASSRQAWADARPQEEVAEEPRLQRSGPRVAGSHVPRRVRSAKTGPVSSRARKGTMIRPQSASEAQRVVRTQGKAMVPRPPPRSEVFEAASVEPTIYITKTAYNSDCPHSKAENPDSQLVSQPPVLKVDEGTVLAPVPPSYAYTYETVSKGIYALCQPEAQAGSARRPLQYGENGICLDRTPTDEEISLLWHGVRSALASKEAGRGAFESTEHSLCARMFSSFARDSLGGVLPRDGAVEPICLGPRVQQCTTYRITALLKWIHLMVEV